MVVLHLDLGSASLRAISIFRHAFFHFALSSVVTSFVTSSKSRFIPPDMLTLASVALVGRAYGRQ